MKNLCIVTLMLLIDVVFTQSMYRAAVIEYAPRTSADSFVNRVLENVQEYVNYIAEAADEAVDIIIFPEFGLTGEAINENNIYDFSMEVPDPKLQISPCNANNFNYTKALIDLSCSAKIHRLYVVVNVVERRNDTGNVTYYNTNTVFDREGVVIARFRKINLFKEAHVKPGNETVTFRTDFGVTFGMFICNDILFKKPGLETIADSSVADIIYSTAWFTELPFSESLSIQHGYAVSNGVNLLGAGLNDPSNTNGGSGIFLANGDIADTYKSAAKSSKMLIANVPKIERKNDLNQCRHSSYKPIATSTDDDDDHKRFSWGTLPSISAFQTHQMDMTNFTFKSIQFNQTNITEELCVGTDREFCCHVNITINMSNKFKYFYKLAVFNGGRELGWETVGIRTCALVACSNDNATSCGLRQSDTSDESRFQRVFIKAVFPKIENAHDQPSTLGHDLKPINNYTFCKDAVNDKMELTLFVMEPNPLMTFGVFGRVYDNDYKGAGSFNNSPLFLVNPYIVFFVSGIVFLLQN